MFTDVSYFADAVEADAVELDTGTAEHLFVGLPEEEEDIRGGLTSQYSINCSAMHSRCLLPCCTLQQERPSKVENVSEKKSLEKRG